MKPNIFRHLALLAAVLLLAVLTACRHWNENYEKTYPELITHFANCGLKVDSVTPLAYYLARAESAYAFKIGSREIGIYKYNLERKKQRYRYQVVKDSGVLYINGKKFKAMLNGCFVMIDFDTHPEQEKIVKAFESF